MTLARACDPFEGELDGLAWDGAAMLFCVLAKNEIRRYDPARRGSTVVRQQSVRTRGLAFASDGRLFGAQGRARRIVWYRDDGASFYTGSTVDGLRRNDPQHLVVDGKGRIWSTDRWTDESSGGPVGYPPLDRCSVLRSDPLSDGSWTLRRMTDDTVAPHGIALGADERTLFVTDGGPAPQLRAYRITGNGDLGPGQVIREYDGDDRPLGICVDASGRVVVAVSGARPRIEVVGSDGSVAASAAVEGGPTACAFGGSDLYVTTSAGELLRGGIA